jgi:cytochrome c
MRELTHFTKLAALLAFGALNACGVRGATEAEMGNGKNMSGTGALLYERECESCHGDHGQGTTAPAVLGNRRYARGKFKNAQELFDYVAKNMPKDKPGSLDITQYWNIVTFVVATTGTPIPGDRLSESNASDVKF